MMLSYVDTNVVLVPVEHIRANPYQTRLHTDPAHIAEIAQSIRDVGLLQIPVGRRIAGPDAMQTMGHVELAFGHSRFAAWMAAKPGEPLPVELRELDDLTMSTLAAEENARRKNLSAIETATAIQRRIADFGLTQVEAARPFGYASAGAVSNLLRLLALPEDVQQMVHAGELPERHARALTTLTRIDKGSATRAAKEAIKNPVAAERIVDDALEEALENRRDCKIRWDLNWLTTPHQLSADNIAADDDGELTELPACAACPHLVKVRQWREFEYFCVRDTCFERKRRLWASAELARVSKQLKIAPAAEGETVSPIDPGKLGWQQNEQLAKLVKKHPAYLRLMLRDTASNIGRQRELTGSDVLMLGTADAAALREALHVAGETRSVARAIEAPANETADQKTGRAEQEERERAERRAEKAAKRRTVHDNDWTARFVAAWLAPQIDARGNTLFYLADLLRWSSRLVPPGGLGFSGDAHIAEAKALNYGNGTGNIDEAGLREAIAMRIVGHTVSPTDKGDPWERDIKRGIEFMLEREFNLKPPRGWDEPPIHKTAANCWHCGRFASGDKLTKRDIAEDGWIDEGKNGVFCCLDHQEAYQQGGETRKPARRSKK